MLVQQNWNEMRSSDGMATEALQLFGLASRRNEWLTARQAAISTNIANANSPGYKAVDVQPFSNILEGMDLSLATTRPGHISTGSISARASTRSAAGAEVTVSGNSVSVEEEMVKAGAVNRDYALNTNIVKAFHKMLMSTMKA